MQCSVLVHCSVLVQCSVVVQCSLLVRTALVHCTARHCTVLVQCRVGSSSVPAVPYCTILYRTVLQLGSSSIRAAGEGKKPGTCGNCTEKAGAGGHHILYCWWQQHPGHHILHCWWQQHSVLMVATTSCGGKISVHNNFVSPELRWKPESVNAIFSWIQI